MIIIISRCYATNIQPFRNAYNNLIHVLVRNIYFAEPYNLRNAALMNKIITY